MIKFNLGVLLAERNLNINKVHKDTGLSRITLSSISNNNGQGIQLDTINKLCQYLKITPGELFIYVPFDISFKFQHTDNITIEVVHNNNKYEYTFYYSIDQQKTSIKNHLKEFVGYGCNLDLLTDRFEYENEEKERNIIKNYLKQLPIQLYMNFETEITRNLNKLLDERIEELSQLEEFANIDIENFHKFIEFSLDEIFGIEI